MTLPPCRLTQAAGRRMGRLRGNHGRRLSAQPTGGRGNLGRRPTAAIWMIALLSRQKVKRQAASHNQEEMQGGRSAWKVKSRGGLGLIALNQDPSPRSPVGRGFASLGDNPAESPPCRLGEAVWCVGRRPDWKRLARDCLEIVLAQRIHERDAPPGQAVAATRIRPSSWPRAAATHSRSSWPHPEAPPPPK